MNLSIPKLSYHYCHYTRFSIPLLNTIILVVPFKNIQTSKIARGWELCQRHWKVVTMPLDIGCRSPAMRMFLVVSHFKIPLSFKVLSSLWHEIGVAGCFKEWGVEFNPDNCSRLSQNRAKPRLREPSSICTFQLRCSNRYSWYSYGIIKQSWSNDCRYLHNGPR